MKGTICKTKDFRVPLSTEALKVIDAARAFERDGYLFSAVRKGIISEKNMSRQKQVGIIQNWSIIPSFQAQMLINFINIF